MCIRDRSSGSLFPAAALAIVLPIFLPVAVAVVGGDSIAGEASSGMLRCLLARPVGRKMCIRDRHPAAPSGMAIIGVADEPGIFSQHYYDSRGVARVYQMSLDGGIWKLWREAPGFWQRFTGAISGDGSAIKGAWEASADGREWKHDFGLDYVKVSV